MAESKVIYLDTASLDQLLQIPQIGKARAEIIVRKQKEMVLSGGSLTLDHFALHPEIATALNASKQTELLFLGQGRNGGLAGAQSLDHQAEVMQSNGKENTILIEKVSSELGEINSKCNQLGEALNKFSASSTERDISLYKSMKDMIDQFTEKSQGLESALVNLGQRIDKVKRAGQPVGKLEPPSDPFFAVLEDAIAE